MTKLEAELVVVFMQGNVIASTSPTLAILRFLPNTASRFVIRRSCIPKLTRCEATHDALFRLNSGLTQIETKPFQTIRGNLNIPLVPLRLRDAGTNQ